jgi:beta-mannanase
MSQWAVFWRRTVQAMRSVPGAHFQFDWTVNAAVRPIPLSDFYPGNASVDIVGIDAYDQGVAVGQPRWDTIYNRPDGIADVLDFANAHGKPLSIPEWGLSAPGLGSGGGDDPSYVNGIGNLVRDNNVAYQSYFFTDQFATQLLLDWRSLHAYRGYFG